MFQYALGRRLSSEREVPLKLNIGDFEHDPLREFGLNAFQIDAAVASATELADALRPWPRRLVRRLPWLPTWPGSVRLIRERGFPFDSEILSAPKNVWLEGYWQTERYFSSTENLIRHDFRLTQPMTPDRQALAATIRDNVAVSVHIRRGDYVTNPVVRAFHGTCPPEWYEKAMSIMADAVGSPLFFVFSDDPDWARANLPDRWPIQYVAVQDDGRDHEDMHLMASCRHHIIANSSFSWWGAWLNPAPDKRVIAPAQWFRDSTYDTRDLLPPTWQRL